LHPHLEAIPFAGFLLFVRLRIINVIPATPGATKSLLSIVRGRDELRNSLVEQSETVRIYKKKCNGGLVENLCP